MEGFLKHLNTLYTRVPKVITKENINVPLSGIITILREALWTGDENVILELLSLKPLIYYEELFQCDNPRELELLLDAGASPNCGDYEEPRYFIVNSFKSISTPWFFNLLLDYGVNLHVIDTDIHDKPNLEYLSLVSSRISSSRKALAALIMSCKAGPFRASRDILFVVAKEMWCMKDPNGCGPRAKLWKKE